MNLLLLEPRDRVDGPRFVVRDQRLEHMRTVLQVEPGKQLRAGMLEGPLGRATVLEIDEAHALLELELEDTAMPRPATDLILAVPRPKSLKKVLPEIATMGVDRLFLLRSWKVSPSYMASPLLEPTRQRSLLLEGLMQGGSTHLPQVSVEPRFLPFVQDRVPAVLAGVRQRVVLDPRAERGWALSELAEPEERVALAIGPEGGFLPYELERFVEAGFCVRHLGSRILRVETAVVAALAQLDMLRQRARAESPER